MTEQCYPFMLIPYIFTTQLFYPRGKIFEVLVTAITTHDNIRIFHTMLYYEFFPAVTWINTFVRRVKFFPICSQLKILNKF